jgi:hypothetical protein
MKPQRTIDFNKVQWADYWWQNQDGTKLRYKPEKNEYSVHNVAIEPNAPAWYHPDYPHETNLERAIRLDVLDKWHPVCTLVFGANKHLRYTGEQATKVWRQYNAHIYSK